MGGFPQYSPPSEGSCVSENELRRKELCVLSPLAGQVLGAWLDARLAVLLVMGGSIGVRNLYITRCASVLGGVLRAAM